ncbi:MAG: c-type cytochrome biogenesis protein CcsB [Mariprofundaceae bacterium]
MSNTITADSSWLQNLNQGRAVFLRFWAHIGIIAGLSAMAIWGGDGYDENEYVFQLASLTGVSWGVAGLLVGLAWGGISIARTSRLKVRTATRLTPWMDGAWLMIALMAIFTLFEPHASVISYEDQSNMLSGKIVMAMNIAFLFSAICYIVYLFAPEKFIGNMATSMAWIGAYAGGSSLLLRWFESYLFLDGEIGHAPVSNLYEVFILLFCIISFIYLSFEKAHEAKGMGAFVMVIVSAGIFFLIWLDSIGQADIKPLVPALQSYWMKIHVPLNFVGYGSFAVACAAGMAFLVRDGIEGRNPDSRLLGVFPTLETLDQLAYKAVAVGFPAFTLATILGAAWAAEAWGGYWSWDPKETWALIVWLCYGAYLHVRVSHGWNGKTLAWWAVAGFLVTLFCFVGVNMYLSGLHSYGKLG